VKRDATVQCTFAYNGKDGTDGSPQSFVVPPGVHSVTIDAFGALGGGEGGGRGGHARGTFSIADGTVLHIRVGGTPGAELGGYNGGGNGGASPGSTPGDGGAPAGGGGSDVRIGGNTLADRVIVAGGGGGAGVFNESPQTLVDLGGGAGGGAAGQDGTCLLGIPYFLQSAACGHGGASSTGGAVGTSHCENDFVLSNLVAATPGTAGDGGAGASMTCIYFNTASISANGAGGGGGWFGGGGGGGDLNGTPLSAVDGGGGGGSSFVSSSATAVVNETGVGGGNGTVFISYTP
jgi:hypothetical protein